jgi:HTH-type transcriptional regulator/antitoxin HigA
MGWTFIRTEQEHQQALNRLEEIFDAPHGTPLGDELDLLSLLIDTYEKETHPIDLPDPIQAILPRMEQAGK